MRRTDDELRALSDPHLLYEIQMLSYAIEQLGPEWQHVPRTATQHEAVLLESWAVHARNLADFLYPPKSRGSKAALAEHYFEPGEWDEIRPHKPRALVTIKRRASQELAHLDYARLKVTPELKPWQITTYTNDLVPPLQAFLKNVSPERVSARFRAEAPLYLRTTQHARLVATGLRPQLG